MKKMKLNPGSVIVILLILLGANSASAQNEQRPYIEIQAKAERQVVPDELYLTIKINESDYKGKKTLQEMQQALLGAMKVNRIDVDNCLSISYMGSTLDYKRFSSRIAPKGEITYLLKLSDMSIVQSVIESLEQRSITNIELTETKYSKGEEIIKELSVEAMKKAKELAAIQAGAIDQEIGKALSISSWNSSNQQQPRIYKMRASNMVEESADADFSAVPAVSVSKITYTVNVNVRFELK